MKLFIFKPQFIIFPIALVVSIVYRKELFVNFMSASLLFMGGYFTVVTLIARLIGSKKSRELAVVNVDQVFPFIPVTAELASEGIAETMPGYVYYIEYTIYENDTALRSGKTALYMLDNGHFAFDITFDRHGVFYLRQIRLHLADILHFTETTYAVESVLRFDVHPYYKEFVIEPPQLDYGGGEPVQSIIRRNSTDLFDVRKYFPGDDFRRLNWNIFAHIGELYVRELEKIPPDIGELSVIFAPYSQNTREYELATSVFYAVVNRLFTYNVRLKIWSPVKKEFEMVDRENSARLSGIIDTAYCRCDLTGLPLHSLSFGIFSAEEFLTLHIENRFIDHGELSVCLDDGEEYRKRLRSLWVQVETHDSALAEYTGTRRLIGLARQRRQKVEARVADLAAAHVHIKTVRV